MLVPVGIGGARARPTRQVIRTFTSSTIRHLDNGSESRTIKSRAAGSPPDATFAYPSSLNIFHSGSALTAYIGTIKLAGIYVFAQSCLFQAPTIYLDSPDDFWWTPAAIALSSIPMILLQLMTGPFVNSIDVQLPAEARKTQKSMQTFCTRPPPDTRLSFTTLRFFPLPKRRAVRLEDLRVLPRRTGRVANLEYLPPKLRQKCEQQGREAGWFEGLVAGRRRFHVRPGQRYTSTTRGPGIWADLLRAIELQSVGMSNEKASVEKLEAKRSTIGVPAPTRPPVIRPPARSTTRHVKAPTKGKR